MALPATPHKEQPWGHAPKSPAQGQGASTTGSFARETSTNFAHEQAMHGWDQTGGKTPTSGGWAATGQESQLAKDDGMQQLWGVGLTKSPPSVSGAASAV
jgi:hypothetical protein